MHADSVSARPDSWYALWTNSHCEQLVAEQLTAKGFAAFLPELRMWSRRMGGMQLTRKPMFPGYLFVRHAMDKHSYIEMVKVRGLVRILEDGWKRLTAIPDVEVDAIQRIVRANVPVQPHEHLQDGDRVRVREGALTGLEGIFVQHKRTRGRLVVSVNLLGRSVAVEVDCTSVIDCAPRSAAV